MQKTDMGRTLMNRLPVEFKDKPEHPMGSWMLRTYADDEVSCAEPRSLF